MGEDQSLLHLRRNNKLITSSSSFIENSDDARKILATRPSGYHCTTITETDKEMISKANIHGVIFPWRPVYRCWWFLTIAGAIITVFLAPYQIAFEEQPGTLQFTAGYIEKFLTIVFAVDIGINFNLAFTSNNNIIVYERQKIIRRYLRRMFWIDLIGVFPFETVALIWIGALGESNRHTLMLSLWRLLRFVRLHRMKQLSDELQYNARVSLLSFTLLRNFAVVLVSCHCQACCMYFLARLHQFDPQTTWLGSKIKITNNTNVNGNDETIVELQRYVVSLYWSITTFCTVGYGDYSPVNSTEQIVGSTFMLINVVLAAWIIGAITLLIVKGDEKTGEYRDSLETLHTYGTMHHFDTALMDKLKEQLHLEFQNREIADEQVLQHFPSAVRRKILRRLYKEPLVQTGLMQGVRPQFVDAFLTSCSVEIFSPGEEIVERGSILSDLFLLVGGVAEVVTISNDHDDLMIEEDGHHNQQHEYYQKLESGDFIGEIGFFTESPQVDSVISLTVCKTLTMSRSTYKLLAQDHPGSVGKILENLLTKVEGVSLRMHLPKKLTVLRVGSNFDVEAGYGTLLHNAAAANASSKTTGPGGGLSAETESIFRSRHDEMTAVEDLIKLHMEKQIDDQTTRLLFAASRGDTKTITLMCDHGFDPNNSDYDQRTALMVASMKGNTDAAKLLLEYKADPNLTDMHGSSALLEAVKNGHEATMELLFEYGADLCMAESLAASILCQAVFDGDVLLLKRLLKAGIDINAADYDKRTAAHIAAAEGNVAAIRVLAERGAELTLPDRWGNTVRDEAKRSNARQLLAFLERLDEEHHNNSQH